MLKHLTFIVPSLVVLLVSANMSPSPAEHGQSQPSAATVVPTQKTCVGTLVDVTAPSSSEHEVACAAARQALQLLGLCKIALRGPLKVEITNNFHHPFGSPVLGFFDVGREKVIIRPLESMLLLVSDGPFAVVAPTELHASIIVHEIIHGVLHQNATGYMMSHTAGEYIAYALQIASLSPSAKRQFLQAVPVRGALENFVFSDILLSLDPFLFAAQAYHHFDASPDACQYAVLLQRDLGFIASSYGYF
jgi:hypothetical protein